MDCVHERDSKTAEAAILADFHSSFHPIVLDVLSAEKLWYSNPVLYLNNHFANDAQRTKMSLEEFLRIVEPTSEKDAKLATEVFNNIIEI